MTDPTSFTAEHRSCRRLTHRPDGASVATDAIDEVDRMWESLLTRALDKLA